MKVTEVTKRVLAFRRQERALKAAGYTRHETDWEIHRGCKIGQRIVDVKISTDGLHVYTKVSGTS